MKNEELISVIIPVYNVEKYIVRCVDSVVEQSYQNLEIILVDDGGLDGSGKICDELGKRDDRIKVIHQSNKGLSGARNTGIDIACGEYLLFVDSDDYIEKDMIQTLYKLVVDNDADMSCCSYKKEYESNSNSKEDVFSDNKETLWTKTMGADVALELFLSQDFNFDVAAWNKLFRKNVFDNLRWPEGVSHEDGYLIADIMTNVSRVSVIDKKMYHYIKRSGSITTSVVSNRNIKQSDYDMLNSYLRCLRITQQKFPVAVQMAEYRLYLAQIQMITRMCFAQGVKVSERKDLLKKMRQNYKKMMRSNFGTAQKIAITALRINLHLYKFLVYWKVKIWGW